MTASSTIVDAISARARAAVKAATIGAASTEGEAPEAPPADLVAYLGRHLRGGETHYPVRPGMVELRSSIATALTVWGLPDRGPDSVLVTASEGEGLFTTLLALGLGAGGLLRATPASSIERHRALLSWLGVETSPAEGDDEPDHIVVVAESGTRIAIVGTALFGGDLRPVPADLLIGSLAGLNGFGAFSLGFVAGDPDRIKDVTKWKQASSICAPGPSQRAALWALDELGK